MTVSSPAFLQTLVDSDEERLGAFQLSELEYGDSVLTKRSTDGPAPPALPARSLPELMAEASSRASAFQAERLGRRVLRQRSLAGAVSTAPSKGATEQISASEVEDLLAYFHTLQAKATTALAPFLHALLASNNTLEQQLALPLYGMVMPPVLIDSPFGPGPFARDLDAFDDIQSRMASSGNYTTTELAQTAAAHGFMRRRFHAVWDEAVEAANKTGELRIMENTMLYLAMLEQQCTSEEKQQLFPRSYFAATMPADAGGLMASLNVTG